MKNEMKVLLIETPDDGMKSATIIWKSITTSEALKSLGLGNHLLIDRETGDVIDNDTDLFPLAGKGIWFMAQKKTSSDRTSKKISNAQVQ